MSISQVNGNERMRAAAALAAQRSAGAYQATPQPARQADSVSLSDGARALSSAHKSIASAPDVREDRVQALKAAIADGTYTVDSRQLARAIAKKLDIIA